MISIKVFKKILSRKYSINMKSQMNMPVRLYYSYKMLDVKSRESLLIFLMYISFKYVSVSMVVCKCIIRVTPTFDVWYCQIL